MQTLKDDVRERIVDSAKAEFLEKGIDKASMRDIAAGSNMTVGNLYRYFKNKEELNSFIVGETLTENRHQKRLRTDRRWRDSVLWLWRDQRRRQCVHYGQYC